MRVRRVPALMLVLLLSVAVVASGCNRPASDPKTPGSTGDPGGSTGGPVATARPQWGSQWTGQTSVQMIDASVGWAVTRDGIRRTADGGASWVTVTPKAEPATSDYGDGFGQAVFLGPDTAFVARTEGEDARAVTLYRTSDGGANWSKTSIATTPGTPMLRSIGFADESNGWLLASFGVAMGSEMVGIYTTADGGTSWQPAVITDPANQQPNSLPLGGTKSGVTFVSDKVGWVTGGWHGDGVWLYATYDGGRTWQRAGLPVPRGYTTEGGAVRTLAPLFFGKNGLIPVVFGPERSIIFFATADSGMTWKATMPVPTGPDGPDFVWAFADASRGWLSDTQRVYATTDGAATWTEIKADKRLGELVQSGFHVRELSFLDATNGWALLLSGSADTGTYALLRTTDGGLTWSDCDDPTAADAR